MSIWPLPMGVPIPAHLVALAAGTDVWRTLRYFKRHEFRHPDKLSADLLVRLDECRHLSGMAICVKSDYRPGDGGAHGRGKAVDISSPQGITSQWRFAVLGAAYRVGFRRIGVYDSHIHVDVAGDLGQDVCWWGVSR